MSAVGFLHTAEVHRPTFETLLASRSAEAGIAIDVTSEVDDGLLALARVVGADHPEVRRRMTNRLRSFDAGAEIVCTCSTVGGVAESVGADLGLAVARVDRPMFERAFALGGRVVVLAAVESTIAPTRALAAEVQRHVTDSSDDVDLRLVDGAWERFESGDLDGYYDAIAAAIETALGAGATVVVLAQASMAPAAERVERGAAVLSSPAAAVDWLVNRLNPNR